MADGEADGQFFLGIDAGGSRCRARLVDGTGAILAYSEAGPANLRIGREAVQETILACARDALEAAGWSGQAFAQTFAAAGIAGLLTAEEQAALLELDWPFARMRVATDAHIAQLGAFLGEDGAVLILGTGSIGLLRRGTEFVEVGGHGFPVDDRAGGAALGLEAVRHTLRVLDGRAEASALAGELAELIGDDIMAARAWSAAADVAGYAALAPLVIRHAGAGDPAARRLVHYAASEAERHIAALVAAGASQIALLGGLAPYIKADIGGKARKFLVEPKGDALTGALLLAGCPLAEVKKS